MNLNEIRKNFLDFFQNKSHKLVKSSSLIPHNDPSLLFTNSGMVQFKKFFTGEQLANFSKITTSQKCLRAGGKHNDLENVGYTARHLTFFEMLGNFSFGDYFKDEAIIFAWEFITKTLGLNKDKLYITIYHEDEEAKKIWKKLTNFSDDKIISIYTNDNFWSMGDTGPSGPCSEIFYDLGENIKGGLPGTYNEDGDRFIEFWNLVFMQYEILTDGTRINLPKPSIDTGMGLERISAIIQGVKSNFEIDLFKNLIEEIEYISKVKQNHDNISSFRVIADHIRSCSFLIGDGILPSNEGRGYVLRRIIRRAARHIHQLGVKNPLMSDLSSYLIKLMGNDYPELQRAEELIKQTLYYEEIKFAETLDRGLKILEESAHNLAARDIFSGEIAFKLYDTYGFPLDLTKDILKARQIIVDENSFNIEMEKQKKLAKKSWIGSGEVTFSDHFDKILNKFGPTIFLDSENGEVFSKIIYLIKDNVEVEMVEEGDNFYLVTDITSFYAESGGQVGDTGFFFSKDQEVQIYDTKKILGKIHVHQAIMNKGKLKLNDVITPKIDQDRRNLIKANHSATHLLHYALRKIVGKHVTQQGSIVLPEKLRFDINHNKALTKEEIELIEQEVNKEIRHNNDSHIREMEIKEAMNIGALALFGEKYEDKVRVISMGGSDDQFSSIELCGGSHVMRTGDIGLFKIISETSIASSTRRIEAITGNEAIKFIQNQQKILDNLALSFKSNQNDLSNKAESLLREKKNLTNEVKILKKKLSENLVEKLEVKNITIIYRIIEIDVNSAREITESDRKKNNSAIIVTISRDQEKISLMIGVTEDLLNKYDATILVKENIHLINGKNGGGKPSFAQAGGADFSKAKNIINSIAKMI